LPEPSTIALMASASAGLAGMMRWRKRRAAKVVTPPTSDDPIA